MYTCLRFGTQKRGVLSPEYRMQYLSRKDSLNDSEKLCRLFASKNK